MIKWWVAKWNRRGIQFYERLGARIDHDWPGFSCPKKRQSGIERVLAHFSRSTISIVREPSIRGFGEIVFLLPEHPGEDQRRANRGIAFDHELRS